MTVSVCFTDVSVAETVDVNVSVIVGDSITLHTNTELQSYGVIEWSFGEDVIISSEYKNKVDCNREKLQLDYQTGDLKIRKVRITDFGLYQLMINNANGIAYKTFNVSGEYIRYR